MIAKILTCWLILFIFAAITVNSPEASACWITETFFASDLEIAREARALGDKEKSLARYQDHITDNPGDEAARVELVEFLHSIDRLETANMVEHALLTDFPNSENFARHDQRFITRVTALELDAEKAIALGDIPKLVTTIDRLQNTLKEFARYKYSNLLPEDYLLDWRSSLTPISLLEGFPRTSENLTYYEFADYEAFKATQLAAMGDDSYLRQIIRTPSLFAITIRQFIADPSKSFPGLEGYARLKIANSIATMGWDFGDKSFDTKPKSGWTDLLNACSELVASIDSTADMFDGFVNSDSYYKDRGLSTIRQCLEFKAWEHVKTGEVENLENTFQQLDEAVASICLSSTKCERKYSRTHIQPIEEVPYREAIVPFLQLRGLESIQAMEEGNALLASDISYKTWLMASKTFPGDERYQGFAVSQLLAAQQALFDILSTGVGYDSSISTSKRISKARSVFPEARSVEEWDQLHKTALMQDRLNLSFFHNELFMQALNYKEKGNIERAVEVLKKGANFYLENDIDFSQEFQIAAKLNYELAHLNRYYLDDLRQAITYYEKVLEIDPTWRPNDTFSAQEVLAEAKSELFSIELEPQVVAPQQDIAPKPIAASEPWLYQFTWSRLEAGMYEARVKEILGKPTRRQEHPGGVTLWYIGINPQGINLRGYVRLDSKGKIPWEGIQPPVFE